MTWSCSDLSVWAPVALRTVSCAPSSEQRPRDQVSRSRTMERNFWNWRDSLSCSLRLATLSWSADHWSTTRRCCSAMCSALPPG
uniref:Putative secreted protein n=1 Tax=Ixodes ricinus TaxID=34613 RepID=A0A6B0TXP7_IXORI